MINKIKLKLFLLIAFYVIFSTQVLQAQGLKFHGNKESMDQRTSFIVFNERFSPVFSKYIDISFDLLIQDFGTFGYLLHIVDDNNDEAYSFTFSYLDKNTSAFNFNAEGKSNIITMDFTNESLKSRWIPVRLYIDLEAGDCSLAVGSKLIKGLTNLRTKLRPLIVFGRRENLVDVPSFAIRNLNISGAKQPYRFNLNESNGEEVHDVNGKVRGKVLNPYWLLNESYHWKESVSIPSKTMMGSKFNEKEQSILFINQDSLFSYNVGTRKLFSKGYANAKPYRMILGTNYLDETNNRIYGYEINSLPRGGVTIAALDIKTQIWQPVGTAFTWVQLHHHNGFFDKNRNQYLVFGGFGNKRYSNNFLLLNSTTDRWDTIRFKGDKISPRFFSSMTSTKNGDYLYIFGGVGNESGDQTVGHIYYEDLYIINLKDKTIKKCWDKKSDLKLVSSEQMILSDDEKYLYIIRYAEYIEKTYLKLYRYSIDEGISEQLGDSIPYISKSICSNVSLFYNSSLKEFYCITNEFDDNIKSVNSHVFTLSAPPVGKAAINLYSNSNSGKRRFLLIVLVSVLIVFGLSIFYFTRKRKKNKIVPKAEPEIPASPVIPNLFTEHHNIPVNDSDKFDQNIITNKESNRIYLYGIFTIYGKTGRDITHLFSIKLKQIFLYILFNSDKEGVSSTLLNNLFWPDKDDKQAKNLKGVTISNLRKALAEIEGIELVYERGYFKIVISEPCFCDYLYLNSQLYDGSKVMNEMLTILERGPLLECTKQDLFDKYKQHSEDTIFSVLPHHLPILYKEGDYKRVLRICGILLKIDPLYEPALTYSIYSYNRQNEHEKIFKIYALFASEYRNSMGEVYPKSLESIIQEA
jgi:two-component SAPR family response regulator